MISVPVFLFSSVDAKGVLLIFIGVEMSGQELQADSLVVTVIIGGVCARNVDDARINVGITLANGLQGGDESPGFQVKKNKKD